MECAGAVERTETEMVLRQEQPATTPVWRRIGDILISNGVVDGRLIKQALKRQKRDRRPIGELLQELGVREADVIAAIGVQIGRAAVDLDDLLPEAEALATLDAATARRLTVIPISVDAAGRIHYATSRPGDDELIQTLRTFTGHDPVMHLAGRNAILRALDRNYRVFDRVETAVEEAISDRVETADRQVVSLQVDAPVVKIVDLLLTQGLRDRASDIHLEPQSDRLRVRYRIDGVLHDVQDLPRDLISPIASRLKILASMDIVDRHRAQDGQIALKLDNRNIDIRVATLETVWGEKVVLRLLDPDQSLVSLPALGLEEDSERKMRRLVASPYGLIVVSGPTGAGKTTTLYSLLNELDRKTLNITTIEDPVEYQFADINQIRINRLAGMTFANGLKAILRQDPDVILVGEVRDAETASIAIQAALTGHLVLCSLHASDSAGAIHRFLDMGIESFLVASALIGVVAQRLVRTNCSQCALPYIAKSEELEFYRSIRGPGTHFKPVSGEGCGHCGGRGFYGRTGVFESLALDEDTRQLVVEKATHARLRQAALDKGMVPLQESAIALVERGRTTVAEAMRAVYVI
jgi:type IV pilus assembly protein PilB